MEAKKGQLFDSVKMTAPNYNKFDLSHDVKMSCKFGILYPCLLFDAIPGDKLKIRSEAMVRFAPMIAPIMHLVNIFIHVFFVPNRIVWKNYPYWISSQPDPETGLVPAHPTMKYTNARYNTSKIYDYMGLPDPGANEYQISPLALAAYQACWNEYYRDQNLIPAFDYQLKDGTNDPGDFEKLRVRAWEHDYFTSCLPFAQKGTPVSIPLGDVVAKTDYPVNPGRIREVVTGTLQAGDLTSSAIPQGVLNAGGVPSFYDPNGTLEVTATTINDLRRAMRLQEWLEKNARGGTRFTEFLKVQYGVISSDARLQRPEYITGVKANVVISEVLNNTGTETAPQGTMAGHGLSYVEPNEHESYDVEEHGYVIGIMSIMPKTAYQQGIDRHWLKTIDATQVFFDSFAHLGEQEVLNHEIYAPHTAPYETFGYIPRYAEYKYINNRVAGDFRTTLDFWHMGRIFENEPALNQEFIECNATTRIFAVEDGTDYIWTHIYHDIQALRGMPIFGTPTF